MILSFLLGVGLFMLLLLLSAGIVWCLKGNAAVIQWVAKATFAIWVAVTVVLFFKGQPAIATGWIMAMALFLGCIVYKNKKEGR